MRELIEALQIMAGDEVFLPVVRVEVVGEESLLDAETEDRLAPACWAAQRRRFDPEGLKADLAGAWRRVV